MSGDAIRVSVKDGESYAKILKVMKAKINSQNAGVEVLSIRRPRREEFLLVLKKAGDVSAFKKMLDQAVREKAEVESLVPKRSLAVRDLEETVSQGMRILLRYASRLASQTSGTNGGCTSASAVHRLQWSV